MIDMELWQWICLGIIASTATLNAVNMIVLKKRVDNMEREPND